MAVPPVHRLVVDPGGSRWGAVLREDVGSPLVCYIDESVRADGTVVFERVPAGRYRLYHGGEWMWVTVPVSGVVRFAPETADAVHVRIDDESGPLAAAGLRTDDLIVGLDGAEFDGDAYRALSYELSRAAGPLALTVQRGAGRLVIPADAKLLEAREGISLEPTRR